MKDWRSWDKLAKRQRWNPVERARGWNSPGPGYIYSRRKLSKCKTSPGYCQNPLRLHPRKKIRGLPGPPRTFASNHLHLTRLSHIFSLDRRPGITASFSLAPLRTIRCPNLQRGRGSLSLSLSLLRSLSFSSRPYGDSWRDGSGERRRIQPSVTRWQQTASERERITMPGAILLHRLLPSARAHVLLYVHPTPLARPSAFVRLSVCPSVCPSVRSSSRLSPSSSLSLCGCSAAAALLSQRHSAVH